MRISDWSSDVCSSDLRLTHCRKVVCSVGGFRDMREAVEAAGVDLIVASTSRGVLGFGADDDFRSSFGSFDIAEFDIAHREKGRMSYDSHERGLIRSALIERTRVMEGKSGYVRGAHGSTRIRKKKKKYKFR